MSYKSNLVFFKKLMAQYRLNVHIINSSSVHFSDIDMGIRKFLGVEKEYYHLFNELLSEVKPNTIYYVSDDFFHNYIVLRTSPQSSSDHLIIGPFLAQNFTKEHLLNAMTKYQLSPQLMERITQHYGKIPIVSDFHPIQTIINTFADILWGKESNYIYEHKQCFLSNHRLKVIPFSIIENITEQKDISFKMELFESRYAGENRFIQAIAQGNSYKAESAFSSSSLTDIEDRVTDPVRNLKNYAIVLNTLLRKGAELGSVHPIHIDKLSRECAVQIEMIPTLEEGKTLMKKMIRKYCLLVKNYSMKNYSLPIRKVITRIDTDITADQSLKVHAQLLNVNPSYLSTLFKKETGVTLTEYVNRKRVDYAIFLLNTTNMQIQTIANYCGITDLNYFTRIFKKYIGKTPSEYRNGVN